MARGPHLGASTPRISNTQFDVHNVAKSIWCGSCKGCHASTAWKCQCSEPWHRCCVHFCAPTSNVQQHVTPSTRGHRRPAVVDVQVSARKFLRLEPSIASRVILTPRLAARFPHLVTRGAKANTHAAHQDWPKDPMEQRTQSPQ